MTNVYEATKPVTEPGQPAAAPKSNCGCWIGGCLGIVLLGIVIVGVMAWLGLRYAGAQIEKFTDDKPQELPVVQYDEEQLAALETRMEDFKKALADNQETEDLVLTADDINALIAKEEQMKGKVFVEIHEGEIKGDVSIPLDFLPLGVGKGRYFNGSGTFQVSITNGILIVKMDEAEVKGEPLPEDIMQGLRNENLAKDFRFENDSAKVMRRIEEVVVEDGKVVLKVKPPTEKPADKPEGSAEDSAAAESEATEKESTESTESAEPAAAEEAGEETQPAEEAPAETDAEAKAEVEGDATVESGTL